MKTTQKQYIFIQRQILCSFSALLFAGCGIYNIPPESRGYFERKTTSFSCSNGEKLHYYKSGGTWNVQICIDGNDDSQGLKVINSMSRDPQLPTVGMIKVFVSNGKNRTIFSCSTTRDDLLKGKQPQATIRNGIRMTGPFKGKRSDYSPTGLGAEADADFENIGHVTIIAPGGRVLSRTNQ